MFVKETQKNEGYEYLKSMPLSKGKLRLDTRTQTVWFQG